MCVYENSRLAILSLFYPYVKPFFLAVKDRIARREVRCIYASAGIAI
jgi:hypothetical protein